MNRLSNPNQYPTTLLSNLRTSQPHDETFHDTRANLSDPSYTKQQGRREAKLSEATEDDIDDQLGWRQKERRKVQQLHYSGTRELVKKARTTMML